MTHIPFSYSLRNLRRRPWRAVITASGVAVIVFSCVLMLSLCRGLSRRLEVTGEEQNILVISRQGQNVMFSSIAEDEVVELSSLPGLAKDAFDEPLVSPEIMHTPMVGWSAGAGSRHAPLSVRGVTPIAYEVHKSVRVKEGRLPQEEREILAGCAAHVKLGLPEDALAPGQKLTFEDQEWTICGRFEAGGSLIESELWVSEDTLKNMLRRQTHTLVVMRLTDAAAVPAAMEKFSETGALERYFKGWPERDYYREFEAQLSWIFWLSILMVITVAVAGALIGANTMYTAVINRIKEIATCRVLGFPRFDIFVSLMTESILLAVMGGIVGTLAGLLVNGLPLRISYGAFYLVVDWVVIAAGLGLSLLIGCAGGLFPIIKGLRMKVVEGLRYA